MLALVKDYSNKLSNYPRLRILLIVVLVIVVLVVLMNLLTPKAPSGPSPSEVQAAGVAPGEHREPEQSQQAISQYNQLANTSAKQQFQQTVSSGGSAFQNPFDNNSSNGDNNSGKDQTTNQSSPVSPQEFASQQQAQAQAHEAAAAASGNSAATSALQSQLNQLQQQLATQQQTAQNNATSQTEMNMRNSLTQLVGSWKTPNASTVQAQVDNNTSQMGPSSSMGTGPVIIKAGTIYFAVLGTALNSDQPNTPVMATIVNGPYQGAKLMGAFQRENDALVVQFNIMSLSNMANTIGIVAYAIDANTANNAIATSVDNHYLLRYGMLFAASFMQGFGNAYVNYNYTCPPNAANCTIINSNGTPNTATTATTATYQGLGQIGTNLGSAAMNVFNNTPPTVKVAQGTGIGILFTSDVTLTPSGSAASPPSANSVNTARNAAPPSTNTQSQP